MLTKNFFRRSIAALACAAALAAAVSPASALTLAEPSLPQAGAASHVDKVWCGWGGCGWGGGWGPAAIAGGIIAGTAIGAAAAASAAPYPYPYYGYGPGYGYYAPAYYAGPPRPYYGGCWRRWIGPYGRVHWRRVC